MMFVAPAQSPWRRIREPRVHLAREEDLGLEALVVFADDLVATFLQEVQKRCVELVDPRVGNGLRSHGTDYECRARTTVPYSSTRFHRAGRTGRQRPEGTRTYLRVPHRPSYKRRERASIKPRTTPASASSSANVSPRAHELRPLLPRQVDVVHTSSEGACEQLIGWCVNC